MVGGGEGRGGGARAEEGGAGWEGGSDGMEEGAAGPLPGWGLHRGGEGGRGNNMQ